MCVGGGAKILCVAETQSNQQKWHVQIKTNYVSVRRHSFSLYMFLESPTKENGNRYKQQASLEYIILYIT